MFEEHDHCDHELVDTARSLADGLGSLTESLSQTPEFRDSVKHSVKFMWKALSGLVRRTEELVIVRGLRSGVRGCRRRRLRGLLGSSRLL